MRLDEISRRGFIGAVGAAATSTVMPGKEIAALVKSITTEVGGVSNLKILAQLIGMFGASRLDDFYEYNSGEYSFAEVLTDQEQKDLAEKIVQLPDREFDPDINPTDYHDIVNDYVSNNDIDDDISVWASKLIGRKTEYLQALDIISKNGVDEYDFFDYHDGVGKVIGDLSLGNSEIGNLGAFAKSAALPIKTIRIATIISSIYNKIVGKNPSTVTQPTAPSQPAPEKPTKIPALPAPSDKDEIEGINDISRIKDLAGIKR
jgi:hypothetical protein